VVDRDPRLIYQIETGGFEPLFSSKESRHSATLILITTIWNLFAL
jgi:hypothetical protein